MILFFNLGTGEIILILLVLFVVLGPKNMPEVARGIGKTINEMKRASSGFKNEINKEVQKLEREIRINEYAKKEAEKPAEIKAEETIPFTEQISSKKTIPKNTESLTNETEPEIAIVAENETIANTNQSGQTIQ